MKRFKFNMETEMPIERFVTDPKGRKKEALKAGADSDNPYFTSPGNNFEA